ncbi:MAG: hypothetical protein HYZ27_08610, partial [Deltaproteobacteria bacterium]|nr:hypothetical protein [Deltaproteobacteria bacterium]
MLRKILQAIVVSASLVAAPVVGQAGGIIVDSVTPNATGTKSSPTGPSAANGNGMTADEVQVYIYAAYAFGGHDSTPAGGAYIIEGVEGDAEGGCAAVPAGTFAALAGL